MNTKILSLAILSLSFYFTACVPPETNNNNSEELSKKQQEIDKLTKELNDAKTKINTGTSGGISQTDYDKALKSIKEKEEALQELTQEKEALEQKIKNTPAVATVDSNQVAELQEKLASMQQEKETVDNAKKNLEEAAEQNNQKIKELEGKITENNLSIQQKEEHINSLNQSLKEKGVDTTKLNSLNEQKNQLEQANQTLTDEKADLKQEKAELAQEKSALETEKDTIKQELAKANEELAKLQKKEQLATTELQQVKKDLELAKNNAQAAVIPQIINNTLSKNAKDALFASAVIDTNKNMPLLLAMFDDNNVGNDEKIKLVTKIIKDKNTTDEAKPILEKASTIATSYNIANQLLTTIVDNPSDVALGVLNDLLTNNDKLSVDDITNAFVILSKKKDDQSKTLTRTIVNKIKEYKPNYQAHPDKAIIALLPLVKNEGDNKLVSQMINNLLDNNNLKKLDTLENKLLDLYVKDLLTAIVNNPSEVALRVLNNLLTNNDKLSVDDITNAFVILSKKKDDQSKTLMSTIVDKIKEYKPNYQAHPDKAIIELLPLVKNEGDNKLVSQMINNLLNNNNLNKLDTLENNYNSSNAANGLLTAIVNNPSDAALSVLNDLLTNNDKLSVYDITNAFVILSKKKDDQSKTLTSTIVNKIKEYKPNYQAHPDKAIIALLPLVKNEGDDKLVSQMINNLLNNNNLNKLDTLKNEYPNTYAKVLLNTIVANPSDAALRVLNDLLTNNDKLTVDDIKDALNTLDKKPENNIINDMKDKLKAKNEELTNLE